MSIPTELFQVMVASKMSLLVVLINTISLLLYSYREKIFPEPFWRRHFETNIFLVLCKVGMAASEEFDNLGGCYVF